MSILSHSQTIYHECSPVNYWKIFENHHPAEMNEPESSFFFDSKHKQNADDNIWYKKSPLGKNEVSFESCLKQFCLQNLKLINSMYLWLCNSGNWLPECEKSWALHISIYSTSAKNVIYTWSVNKCPHSEQVTFHLLFMFTRKNEDQALLQKVNSQLMHIPRRQLLELLFQVINCAVTEMAPKRETSHKHQESHFVCWSWIFTGSSVQMM